MFAHTSLLGGANLVVTVVDVKTFACEQEGEKMWCHTLMAMPLLGLGLFIFLPFSWALAIYLIIVLISLLLYYKIMQSMRAPVLTGAEALLGRIVTTGADGSVHWQGEWWTAEPMLPNQTVRITALRRLRLRIEPIEVVASQSSIVGDQKATHLFQIAGKKLLGLRESLMTVSSR